MFPFLEDCTILYLGQHILLCGLDKIGWTAQLEYPLAQRYNGVYHTNKVTVRRARLVLGD